MSNTQNVTFQITREQRERLDKEAYRRTVATGRVVTRSEVIRAGIDAVCAAVDVPTADSHQAA